MINYTKIFFFISQKQPTRGISRKGCSESLGKIDEK